MCYRTAVTLIQFEFPHVRSDQTGEKSDCRLTLGCWVSVRGPTERMPIYSQERVLLLHAKPDAVLFNLLHHFAAALSMVSF